MKRLGAGCHVMVENCRFFSGCFVIVRNIDEREKEKENIPGQLDSLLRPYSWYLAGERDVHVNEHGNMKNTFPTRLNWSCTAANAMGDVK